MERCPWCATTSCYDWLQLPDDRIKLAIQKMTDWLTYAFFSRLNCNPKEYWGSFIWCSFSETISSLYIKTRLYKKLRSTLSEHRPYICNCNHFACLNPFPMELLYFYNMSCLVTTELLSGPNAITRSINESETNLVEVALWLGPAPKCKGFFFGPRYTLPPNYIEIGLVCFAQPCWQTKKQTALKT